MDLGLDGKVALVTGASRGIGLGIAKALAAEARESRSAPLARADRGGGSAARRTGAGARLADLDGAAALVDRVERGWARSRC